MCLVSRNSSCAASSVTEVKVHVHRARDWRLCPDQADGGVTANWPARVPDHAVAAPVPGIIQQVFPDYHGVAWYWCELAPVPVPTAHRALLGFESVDCAARVWVNGHEVGSHEGDGVPFVLVDAPGAVRHGAEIAPGELDAVLAELCG